MSKVEFLQMVPALLYGISLAEIAMFLGNIFRKKERIYWEHLLAILLSFETVIFNWYVFYDRLDHIDGRYIDFVIQLMSPICFFIYAANILIESKSEDGTVKIAFLENRKQIFISLTMFIVVNIGTVFYFTPHLLEVIYIPIAIIGIVATNIFVDSKALRCVLYVAKGAQMIYMMIKL